MKRLSFLLILLLLVSFAFSQSISPLVIKDFKMKPNEIIDIDGIPANARTDMNKNPISRIRVKASGFNENMVKDFVFIADGIEITHKALVNGQVMLHVSSNSNGAITIKYKGDCVFTLPHKLEPRKVYELTLSIETATLIVVATPEEAEIVIDGETVGTGYASVAVSLGANHHCKVQCLDYETFEGDVAFSKSEKKEVDVELNPDFGYITIMSKPSGAAVYIDNQKVGRTPYQCERISAGKHKVVLLKKHYEGTIDSVYITKGETNDFLKNKTLKKKYITYGKVVITSNPEGAIVSIDGRQYGRTPLTLNKFETGIYKVTLSMQGCEDVQKMLLVGAADNNLSVDMPLIINNIVSADGVHLFSVNDNKTVCFSQGNLQYQASTKTWRFAENQWDVSPKRYNMEDKKDWIDLMQWGTSGYNGMFPRTSNVDEADWGGHANIAGTNYDWGVYCKITNGGLYKWRTLTIDEWDYLLNKRTTSSRMRFAKAKVNNVNGLIILPDDWNSAYYKLNGANGVKKESLPYSSNVISLEDWQNVFEANGAVFLPTSNMSNSYYWSSTHDSYATFARGLYFEDKWLELRMQKKSSGSYVRLVRDAK